MHPEGNALGVFMPGNQAHISTSVAELCGSWNWGHPNSYSEVVMGPLAIYHHLFSPSREGVTAWYGCPTTYYFPASLRSYVAV